MAGDRRMPRAKATAALVALLETICAGGSHADGVTAVYVFGTYACGARTVGDIDVDIECDARLHPDVERELLDNLVVGRDWNTPFRKALKPARALQVMFSKIEMIADPVLVYERGDTLDQRWRVDAIAPDPEAGRAERDPVHPAIEPVAEGSRPPDQDPAQRADHRRPAEMRLTPSSSATASMYPSSNSWRTASSLAISGECMSESLLIGSSFHERRTMPPATSRVFATRLR
jgi:predicted nucleotidyltransferase